MVQRIKAVRFLHIPKTAGSTFNSILRRQYSGKTVFYLEPDSVSNIESYRKLCQSNNNRVALFLGHAPITTGLNDADSARIIVFLRDPISRIRSFCQHVSEGKSAYLVKEFPPGSFSLDKFLFSGNRELENLQTKMLINDGDCASSKKINNMSFECARDLALNNLEKRIMCFGLQEYFDESLIYFSDRLGWGRKIPFYLRSNKKDTRRLLDFKPHHIERIAEMNAIDREVYEAAKKQFFGMLDSGVIDKQRLNSFRLINKVCAIPLKIARSVKRSIQ